jgi:HSP20 family protein
MDQRLPLTAAEARRSWAQDELQAAEPSRRIVWRVGTRSLGWRPPTDVFETEAAFVVRIEVAGMREDDFAIELDERYLYIRGTRLDTPERRAYQQMEIRFGEFSVAVELPEVIAATQVQATYGEGFLRVVLPKSLPRSVYIEDGIADDND